MKKSRWMLCAVLGAFALLAVFGACDLGYSGAEVDDTAKPLITSQPESAGVNVGGEHTFAVEAALPPNEEGGGLADGELSFQWYRFLTFRAYYEQAGFEVGGADGAAAVSDATSSSLTVTADQEGEFHYYVVVTNTNSKASGRKSSAVKSESVTLTVNNPDNARLPVISRQPEYSGEALTYSLNMALPTLVVEASVEPEEESDELRFQWYATDYMHNSQGEPVPGATAPRFSPLILLEGQDELPGMIKGAGSYYYFAIVTNYKYDVAGRRESSVASHPVLIEVGVNPDAEVPAIAAHPASATYFIGETVQAMSASVDEPEDGGVISYQWYSNTSNANTGGTAIEGATGASYTPPISTGEAGTFYYYVEVTNTNTFVTNPVSTITSRPAEVVVASPSAKTANATFEVLFGGMNQLQYVRGFGGMDVAWGNFPDYSVEDYENMYNPDILGYNMLRVMILPSHTDINITMEELVSNQIYTTMDRRRFYENVKTVNRYGGYVLASPWSPPLQWKTNNSINGGGSLRVSDYQNYADYLRAFAMNMLNNGAPVYAISIQNEPNYVAGYDGCEWTGEEMLAFFDMVGRFTEGVTGFGGGKVIPSVKTMNGESANNVGINGPAMGLARVKAHIDVLGRHNYGNRETNGHATNNWIYNSNPREVWMTEHNLNSNSATSYPNDHTYPYIWQFLNDIDMTIRINHESAFIWWSNKRFYSFIGDGQYGSRDGEILPRGWAMAHYAKFAKESYRVNVAASGADAGGASVEGIVNDSITGNFITETVKVTAYMKHKNGEVFPVNWRNQQVPIEDIAEITMVMYTPTSQAGGGGYDMGTVKLQMPAEFKIASATAMRSSPDLYPNHRGEPAWEAVEISQDRNAAFVELPRANILSVRLTQ